MALSKEIKEERKQERKRLKFEKEHKIIEGIDYKLCNQHHTYFPEESPWIIASSDYFYINDKNSIDGLSTRCKRCEIRSSRQYQINNPEQARENKARWHRENQEHKLALGRKWIEEHPEERRQYLRDYYYNNQEQCIEYTRKRKLHKNHEISNNEWQACKEYFNNECACCGKHISKHYRRRNNKYILYDFCKDHYINDGSNDLTNCIPLCFTCNGKKNTKIFEDFYNSQYKYYTIERIEKIYKWIYEDCFKYLDSKLA